LDLVIPLGRRAAEAVAAEQGAAQAAGQVVALRVPVELAQERQVHRRREVQQPQAVHRALVQRARLVVPRQPERPALLIARVQPERMA